MQDYFADTVEIEGIILEVDKPSSADDERKRYGAICRALRKRMDMNRPEFSVWLGIPYRTIQDWELGQYKMPEYVLRLIAYKVKIEEMLKRGKLVEVKE